MTEVCSATTLCKLEDLPLPQLARIFQNLQKEGAAIAPMLRQITQSKQRSLLTFIKQQNRSKRKRKSGHPSPSSAKRPKLVPVVPNDEEFPFWDEVSGMLHVFGDTMQPKRETIEAAHHAISKWLCITTEKALGHLTADAASNAPNSQSATSTTRKQQHRPTRVLNIQSLSTVDPGIGEAYRRAAADMTAARPPVGYNRDHVARLAGEGAATAMERSDAVESTQIIHSEKLRRRLDQRTRAMSEGEYLAFADTRATASFCNDAKKRRRLAELVGVRPTPHVTNQRDALMLLGLMGYHRMGLMVEHVWGTRGLGTQDDPISAEEIRAAASSISATDLPIAATNSSHPST